jgi:hypothetical protein
MLPGMEHRQHRDLKNRAEHSHQPTRQRERRMPGVQVLQACPTVPCRLRSHRPALPPAASPALGPSLSPGDEPTIPALAGRHSVRSCRVSVKQRAAVSPPARSWHGSTVI